MQDNNTELALTDFSNPLKLARFKQMMKETNACMMNRERTGKPNDSDDCENAELSIQNYWTFHTHPHGKTTPSGLDIQTSKRLGKKLMCIGLAPNGKIVCYDTVGKRIIREF
jgi:proteasome lid subunit RPN8/RPN11